MTNEEAASRIEKFGYNRLEHKEINPFLQFLGFMWNPLSWVMEAAAIVAIAVSNGFGRPPDWPDFIGIVLLLLANSVIGFMEERQAGNAVKALMESLAPEAKVKRNGEWKTIEAAELVPGDVISIKLGDVIPADGRLISVSILFNSVMENNENFFRGKSPNVMGSVPELTNNFSIGLGSRSSLHRSSCSHR